MENRIPNTITNLLKEKRVFVFYKKPNENLIKSIIQTNKTLYTTNQYKESGFVFTPFNTSEKSILIPENKSASLGYDMTNKPHGLNKKILNQVQNDGLSNNNSLSLYLESNSKKTHFKLVKKTIKFIKAGKADKVVISHFIKKDITPSKIGNIYENLTRFYKNAFVYIWHHPKVGLWVGASPEKLININNQIYSTMALAGTQSFAENIVWEKKDIEEQKWVTEYIYKQLSPLSKQIKVSKSYTHKAGHLAHICTDFKGELSDTIVLKDLLNKLHPTPAICGTPKSVAERFILENEGYNRTFYSGFLGELNIASKTDLFVNLRCMQVNDTTAKLYVGGGITKDSSPDKEWEETINKAEVLGRFL